MIVSWPRWWRCWSLSLSPLPFVVLQIGLLSLHILAGPPPLLRLVGQPSLHLVHKRPHADPTVVETGADHGVLAAPQGARVRHPRGRCRYCVGSCHHHGLVFAPEVAAVHHAVVALAEFRYHLHRPAVGLGEFVATARPLVVRGQEVMVRHVRQSHHVGSRVQTAEEQEVVDFVDLLCQSSFLVRGYPGGDVQFDLLGVPVHLLDAPDASLHLVLQYKSVLTGVRIVEEQS